MTNKELHAEIIKLGLDLQKTSIGMENLTKKLDDDVIPSINSWNVFQNKWKGGLAVILVLSGIFWFVLSEILKVTIKKIGF